MLASAIRARLTGFESKNETFEPGDLGEGSNH